MSLFKHNNYFTFLTYTFVKIVTGSMLTAPPENPVSLSPRSSAMKITRLAQSESNGKTPVLSFLKRRKGGSHFAIFVTSIFTSYTFLPIFMSVEFSLSFIFPIFILFF